MASASITTNASSKLLVPAAEIIVKPTTANVTSSALPPRSMCRKQTNSARATSSTPLTDAYWSNGITNNPLLVVTATNSGNPTTARRGSGRFKRASRNNVSIGAMNGIGSARPKPAAVASAVPVARRSARRGRGSGELVVIDGQYANESQLMTRRNMRPSRFSGLPVLGNAITSA